MSKGKPLTKEAAKKITEQLLKNIQQDGRWNKICVCCGKSCGGRLASYGKPTQESLRGVVCPEGCFDFVDRKSYDGNKYLRLEFIPGKEKR